MERSRHCEIVKTIDVNETRIPEEICRVGNLTVALCHDEICSHVRKGQVESVALTERERRVVNKGGNRGQWSTVNLLLS